LHEIDQPVEQLLLEVLVVEFETSGLRRMGVTFLGGLLPSGGVRPIDAPAGSHTYLFGAGGDQRGGLDVVGDGPAANRFLNFWSDLLGIRSIGRLPEDFYFRLQALERAGKAEVRSRPHIATLNGHTANITVGTSQYYLLRSVLPYASGGVFGGEEVEHFEYVQADVRLDITPWVTGDGGVTAVIRPSFTTPVGPFDPRVPPALQRWSVDTSVRLRDGETFMIGGLIQERSRVSDNRIPLLGRLPLIGRLFSNSERQRGTSELVIFITPHVLSAGERPAPAADMHERHAPEPDSAGAVPRRW
jgi:type IV pilus assembly protein PilQ